MHLLQKIFYRVKLNILDSLGIDLDNLDFSDKEKVSEAEDSIKNSLEEQGVDTSDLDIDLESLKEAE